MKMFDTISRIIFGRVTYPLILYVLERINDV